MTSKTAIRCATVAVEPPPDQPFVPPINVWGVKTAIVIPNQIFPAVALGNLLDEPVLFFMVREGKSGEDFSALTEILINQTKKTTYVINGLLERMPGLRPPKRSRANSFLLWEGDDAPVVRFIAVVPARKVLEEGGSINA